MITKGVYYVAYGKQARDQLTIALKCLHIALARGGRLWAAGVADMIIGPAKQKAKKQGLQVWDDLPPLKLKYSRTLLLHKWDGSYLPWGEHGFQFLDNRILVVCLLDLKQTAAHIKNLDETTLTLDTCGTLYLPVYDDRALWLRRGKVATEFLRVWRQELETRDGWLALTRAMHRTQPLTWYLPPIGG